MRDAARRRARPRRDTGEDRRRARRTPTSTSSGSAPTMIADVVADALRAAAGSGIRAGGPPRPHHLRAERSAVQRRCNGTCRCSTSSGPGIFSRRPARRSPSRSSTPASRIHDRDDHSERCRRFRDEFGNRYPALGPVTIPYSAAPQLVGGSDAGPHRRAYDFISDGLNPPLDFDGHGTHVSGTIGQLTNDSIGTAGVAFNVKLMPVKVLASDWDVHLRRRRRDRRQRRRSSRAASATRRTTAPRSST